MTFDRTLGLVCGWAVFGLLGWGIAEIWKPVLKKDRRGAEFAIATMLIITILKILAIPFFPGHPDFDNSVQRAVLATTVDPSEIFGRGFLDYPPGTIYFDWFYGFIARGFSAAHLRWVVRAGTSLSDLVLGLTVFMAVFQRHRFAIALTAMLCLALNPGMIYDTVVWGQSDSNLALPMLVSALLICERRYLLGWSAAALAVLVKPQALALLPPLAVVTLHETGVRRWFEVATLFLAVIAIAVVPFQIGHPPRFFLDLYLDLAGRYNAGSMNTLNFLALGDLNRPDSNRVPIIGISYFALGMTMLIATYVVVGIQLVRARTRNNFMLAIAVAMIGWVMFAPRMHERYFYCPLVFLIAVAQDSWLLQAAMAWLSATFLWNLYMVYRPFGPVLWVPTTHRTLAAALVNFVAFVAVAFVWWRRCARDRGLSAGFQPGVAGHLSESQPV